MSYEGFDSPAFVAPPLFTRPSFYMGISIYLSIASLALPLGVESVGQASVKAAVFREEALRAWENYEERYSGWERSLTGTVTSVAKDIHPKDEVIWDYSFRVKTNGDMSLVEMVYQNYRGRSLLENGREVYCRNDKYAFVLAPTLSDSQWAISRLRESPDKKVNAQLEGFFDNNVRFSSLVRLPLSTAVPLSEIIAHPQVEIISVRPEGELHVVEISLGDEPSSEGRFGNLLGGHLFLDRNSFWSLRSARLRTRGETPDDEKQLEVEFTPVSVGSGSFMVSRQTRAREVSGSAERELVATLDLISASEAVSRSDFTLTAFGFDEPRLEEPNWRRIALGVAVSVLLVLCGVMLIRLRMAASKART